MNICDRDKVSGALFGVAVGDALGAPLEFMDAAEIRRKHGVVKDMIGGGWLSVEPGEVTDDTQMTIAVAKGIAENPGNPVPYIGWNFIKWISNGPKDVGGTCRASISTVRRMNGNVLIPTEDWLQAAEHTHWVTGGRSAGNGSLMRTVFPGLFYKTNLHRIANAHLISTMTHYDSQASLACCIYSVLIGLLTDTREEESTTIIYNVLSSMDAKGVYDVDQIMDGNIPPSGYVVDSFKCALRCILCTHTFEDAVVMAANMGGDADTIAAITGGLAGAMYGYSSIPARWINKLNGSIINTLCDLSEIAYQNRTFVESMAI